MRRPLLLLALTSVLSFAACGGDDKQTASEYRKEAASICKKAETESKAIKQPTKPSSQAIAGYLKQLLQVNQRTTDRFAKLDPPDSLKAKHDKVLTTNREAVKAVDGLVEKLESGQDPKKVLTGSQADLQKITTDANSAVKALGVPECGNS